MRTLRRPFRGPDVVLALLASLPPSTSASIAGPDPDLADRVLARLQGDRTEIENYTYVETAVLEKRGTDGSVRSRTTEVHEVFMQDGRTMKRPMVIDVAQDSEGFSLVRGEESRFLKDLSSRDSSARRAKENPFDLETLMRCYQLDPVSQEMLADRPVLKVTFTPIEGCLNQSTRPLKIAAALSGFLWVDVEDYDIVRVEGHLLRPVSFGFGLLGRVESFDLEADREPIAPDAHLMTHFEYRARGIALLFRRFDVLSTRYRSAFARRPADDPNPAGLPPSAQLDPEGRPPNPAPPR